MKNLFQVESVRGTARVVCFSPKHNVTMARMKTEEIVPIIQAWRAQVVDLAKLSTVNYVTVFENKGEAMGCSNPHPHGQIWATESIPQEPAKELASLAAYRDKNGCCMLCDLVTLELSTKDRIVDQNDSFVCIVPFWAVWPFETLVLPKTHSSSLTQFTPKQDSDLGNCDSRMLLLGMSGRGI
jgi:UDPglucose--hexose-1-phosphate uridylyltransferase